MFIEWYKIDKIMKFMPEFDPLNIKFIEKLVFSVEDTESYDKVANVEIHFKVLDERDEYSLIM